MDRQSLIDKISKARVLVNEALSEAYLTSKRNIYTFHINGERIFFSVNQLLWLVFGHGRKKHMRVPLFISKGNQQLFFSSINAAARFLAPKVFFAVRTVSAWLHNRIKSIDGWHINYQL